MQSLLCALPDLQPEAERGREAVNLVEFRQAALWLVSGVGREHIRRCEIEQCDTCSDVLGIEERAQSADDVRETTEGNMNAAP